MCKNKKCAKYKQFWNTLTTSNSNIQKFFFKENSNVQIFFKGICAQIAQSASFFYKAFLRAIKSGNLMTGSRSK